MMSTWLGCGVPTEPAGPTGPSGPSGLATEQSSGMPAGRPAYCVHWPVGGGAAIAGVAPKATPATAPAPSRVRFRVHFFMTKAFPIWRLRARSSTPDQINSADLRNC